jgi:cephalosporin-C deacetylase-like acetyl esterase
MGLGDYICPPSGIVALYNALDCKVTMTVKQGMTHSFTPARTTTTKYEK